MKLHMWLIVTLAMSGSAVSAKPAEAPPHVIGRIALAEADAADMIESPSIVIDATGALHATWVSETAPGERTVFLASAAPGQPLGPPRVLARTGIFVAESTVGGRGGSSRTVRRSLRTAPHCARISHGIGGETIVVVFTAATAGDESSVRPMIMRSDDGGRNFSPPQPLGHATAARPTFTGCATSADGRLLYSWLDHRLGVQVPALAATLPESTHFLAETVLEESVGPRGVCPCCPTACAGDDAGSLFLAFRNQVNGFRDIHVARREAASSRFTRVMAVVPPTWQFDGCPHDGPALDVHDDVVTVAWMDAHTGTPAVYVAAGSSETLTFSSPVRLDPNAAGAQGNVRLARDAQGTLHAVWERSTYAAHPPGRDESVGEPPRPRVGHGPHHEPGGRLIVYARQVDGIWTAAVPLASTADVMQTRPVIARDREAGVAAAFFERTAHGKSLVVLRAGDSAVAGEAARGIAAPRPTTRMHPGKLGYFQYCAGCHGGTGGGDGPAAVALPQPPRAFAAAAWRGERTRAGIRQAILDGVPGTAMKPLADVPAATVDAIVTHVANLAGIPDEAAKTSRLAVHLPPLPAVPMAFEDARGGPWNPPREGTLTLVHFWGTSCGECLAEMPALEDLARTFAARGLRVVHLCVDTTNVVEAGRIGAQTAPGATVLIDSSGRAAEQFGARLLPATRIIDRQGRVVASLNGRADWHAPAVRQQVETLLEGAASGKPAVE